MKQTSRTTRMALAPWLSMVVALSAIDAQEPPDLAGQRARPSPGDSILGPGPSGAWVRMERGFIVGTLTAGADAIDEAPSLPSALQARLPGVSVRQGEGFLGSESRVWLRGPSSVYINEPLVIIDGARTYPVHGRRPFDLGPLPSRLEDIDPESIERIEVLRGAAASAIHGQGAAKGVVLVTTKRGGRGPARWSAFAETGPQIESTAFPANFGTTGTSTSTGAPVANCTLAAQGAGSCSPATRHSWNPLESASPFRTGWSSGAGVNVSGGTDLLSYRAGAVHDRLTGVYRRDEGSATTASMNVGARATPTVDVRLTGTYRAEDLRHPMPDYLTLGLLGDAVDDPERRGYGSALIGGASERGRRDERDRRVTGALASTWTPRDWLRGSLLLGYDRLNSEHTVRLRQRSLQVPGFPTSDSSTLIDRTTDVPESRTGTVELEVRYRHAGVAARSALGFQYVRDDDRGDAIEGVIPDGSESRMFGSETHINARQVTKGIYARQHLAWRNVFVTGTVRVDRSSVELFGTAISPTLDVSWTPIRGSDPSATVGDLRFRAAYGRGGGYLIPSLDENPAQGELRLARETAERMQEIEFGGDVALLGNRLFAQVTGYRAVNDQALVERFTQPGFGGPQPYWSNDAEHRTSGVEAAVEARLLERSLFMWNVGVSVAAHSVTTRDAGSPETIIGPGGQRIKEGRSIGDYHPGSYSYTDLNGDRLIAPGEVVLSSGEPASVGSPLPDFEASLRTDLALGRSIRIGALLDRRSGQLLYNSTARARCSIDPNCVAQHDPETPLDAQAAAVAAQRGNVAGYLEDASFTRLREVRMSVALPARWGGSASSARISLTGRNLYLWTNYTGLDPEIVSRDRNGVFAADSFHQPPLRTFALRLDVSW